MSKQLTNEQKEIIRSIVSDFGSDQIQTLGGYAGTGKSTVIKILLDVLNRKNRSFAVAAFTGKAANVLRKKGMPSSTIHGIIYQPFKNTFNRMNPYIVII